mmetsp:Transcript_4969/g.9146  ORF Transcript_4969/g.9146 Transcript_4969/m.9146 type:complete len:991 (+) Transcript_4969:388-3360(+)
MEEEEEWKEEEEEERQAKAKKALSKAAMAGLSFEERLRVQNATDQRWRDSSRTSSYAGTSHSSLGTTGAVRDPNVDEDAYGDEYLPGAGLGAVLADSDDDDDDDGEKLGLKKKDETMTTRIKTNRAVSSANNNYRVSYQKGDSDLFDNDSNGSRRGKSRREGKGVAAASVDPLAILSHASNHHPRAANSWPSSSSSSTASSPTTPTTGPYTGSGSTHSHIIIVIVPQTTSTVGQSAVVELHHNGGLLSQLQGHLLETGGFILLHDDGLGGVIPASLEFLCHHHTTDNAVRLLLRQVELLHEAFKLQSAVAFVGEVEEVGAERFLTDLVLEHGQHRVLLGQKIPGIKIGRMFIGPSPISLQKRARGNHDGLAYAFRRTVKHLAVVGVVHAVEGLAGVAALLDNATVGGDFWDLNQHGADEVHTLHQFQGDVHVEGHLATLLHQLLLWGLVLVLDGHALGEQLLEAGAGVELIETSMGVEDEAASESRETQLSQSAIVDDLGGHIHGLDPVLEVAHQEQIARAVKVVVDALVVDHAQHGTRLGALVTVAVDQGHQRLHGNCASLGHFVCLRDDDLDLFLLDSTPLLLAILAILAILSFLVNFLTARVIAATLVVAISLVLLRAILLAFLTSLFVGRQLFLIAILLHVLLLLRLFTAFLLLTIAGQLTLLLLLSHLTHSGVDGVGLVVVVLHEAERHLGDVLEVAFGNEMVQNRLRQSQERRLISETSHVIMGVGINDLKGLEQLLIQTLHDGNKIAPDADICTVIRLGTTFTGLGILLDADVRVFLEDTKELEAVVGALLPNRGLEVVGHAGVEVEETGNQLGHHFKTLGGTLGISGKESQHLHLLTLVRSTTTPGGKYFTSLGVDEIVGDILGIQNSKFVLLGRGGGVLTAVVFAAVLTLVRGVIAGFIIRRLLGKVLGILAVLGNKLLESTVVLLKTLAHGVKCLVVGGGQLLLIFSKTGLGRDHEILKVSNHLDVNLGAFTVRKFLALL